jgi:hypothetical protein
MATQRKRVKPGDVLELKAGDHFAYLHYIGSHPQYGDAVLVSPHLLEQRASIPSEYFTDGYLAFYPAATSVAQGLVTVVARMPPPKLPERLRRAGARSGRHVDTWIIESASGEVVKATLSVEDLRLPIAAIWNHELLIQRIVEGWNPAHEGHGS